MVFITEERKIYYVDVIRPAREMNERTSNVIGYFIIFITRYGQFFHMALEKRTTEMFVML